MKACVIVTDSNVKRAVSIIEKFEIAEIRLDICQFRTQYYKEIFSSPTKTIATYREADASNASVHKMECLKKALENGAKYIDIELELNPQQRDDLLRYAKGYDANVIISHHDFEKTSSMEILKKKIENARSLGADIVKIVTKVNFRDDCLTLFNLYQGEENLVAFGMGDEAKFTRAASLYLGAPFTYVHYLSSNKTAEGQLGYKEYEAVRKIC
jgi:3-dehydroquinate dehydratase-1